MVASMPVLSPTKQTAYSHGQSMSQFDADGRRQLFGLSKAIRKHAHQSTSPSSEFKYGRKMCQSQESLGAHDNMAKNSPTIEERLRNLLNSDTEGCEGQSSATSSNRQFDKLPTYELASKGCQGSYSPRMAESKIRAERLNRTAGDTPRDMVEPTNRRTRSTSSDHTTSREEHQMALRTTSKSPGPYVRRTQTEALTARQRRCVSAIPASFYDENWNVVPDHPNKQQTSATHVRSPSNGPVYVTQKAPVTTSTPIGRRTPTGSYNQAVWDQRPPPSPSRTTPLPMQSFENDSHNVTPTWSTFKPQANCKNADASTARRTLEYTPSSLPVASKPVTKDNTASTSKPLFRYRRPQPTTSLSLPPKSNSIETSTPTVSTSKETTFSRQLNTVERKSRPIQYTEPPSPAYSRPTAQTVSRNIASESGLKVSSLTSMSSHNNIPIPAKRMTNSRRCDLASSVSPGRSEKSMSNSLPLDDELESRKSEDRDSGAILDAEASVFDFDSSVASESEDEASKEINRRPSEESNRDKEHREAIWSRSSTPTLPPLSPYESDEDTPRNSEPQLERLSSSKSQSKFQNEVSSLPSYENLKKKREEAAKEKEKDDVATYSGCSAESRDHHELSPTESALAESCDRHKAALLTNTSAVKVVTKVPDGKLRRQRSRHSSRASSCDERRVVISHGRQHRIGKRSNKNHKHGHRKHKSSQELNYYDDTEKMTHSKNEDKRKFGRGHVFYRPGEDGGFAQNDDDETASVRSFTSASVTSSILRRNGKRHHRRNHTHAGILEKTYAKEVRAVNKRFSRLEAHVVTLARSVAQLSSEMRHQNNASRDIEELRGQIEELKKERTRPSSRKSSSSSKKSDVPRATLNSKAHPKRVVKLTKFFGEKPPILSLFLTQMGYEKYIKNFQSESIGMVELPYMNEERLKSIGIPLGPRLRILNEAKKTAFV